MSRKLILGGSQLHISTLRLCQQLLENHQDFENTVLIGIQPRGIYFAERIKKALQEFLKTPILLGYLDITFFRDDFRHRKNPLQPNFTQIDFLVEGKKVILIDDVLYTGRTVRAALDALNAFGRPQQVELLTLIDRKYTRELPVQPDYVGKEVNTLTSQKILVEWTEQGATEDAIWLVNQ
jgi:pyrimidine operon attenuation protein / uracil phosphoribosyltransferase